MHVCGNTQWHRSVCCLSPVPPWISASTRLLVLIVSPVWERGREYILRTPEECPWKGGLCLFPSQNLRSSRRNRIRTRVSYPRLCRRPVDLWRAARAPNRIPSRNGRFCLRLCYLFHCVNVCVCISPSPLLRFLDSFCSGCLPSLSTGHARNLCHRNFKSRWEGATLASLHGRRWKMELERPQTLNTARWQETMGQQASKQAISSNLIMFNPPLSCYQPQTF